MVLIVPDTYLVSIKAQSGGQDVVNVIGIRMAGGTAIAVANAVKSAWETAGGPLSKLPTNYKMVEVKAMSLASASGEVHAVAASAQGTVAGALATNGSCALVTYGSGTRNKAEKGRMYFGPLREGDIDTDGRTLSSPAGFTAALQAFRAAVELSGRKWVVVSRKYSTATDIVAVSTQSIIATQRRRIR